MIEQLLGKAEVLFMRYGIRSVAMDDLARELGVSKKTLYQLIDNKEDLIRRIFFFLTNRQKAEIETRREKASNAVSELVEVVKYMLAELREVSPTFRYDLEKYYPSLHQEMEVFHQSYFEQFIRENLEWGIANGLYRSSVDAPVVARLFVNTAVQMGHDELFPVQKYALDKLMEQLFIYHIHGVATAQGAQYFKRCYGEEAAQEFSTDQP